ncbi:MAG: zinc-binding dehydrogenase [Rhodospirillaceae bacterium]|nr:zinc-binding dehydrogenase [Rhodospirillaceae bacterium]
MKAVVLYEHGGQEQLIYETDYRDPEIGAGDVLVRVKASSLNYHDVFTRRGMPGIKLNLPVIPGLDVAGEVAEIGPEVEGWSVGDRVLVDPINRVEGGLQGETVDGGMAELCRVRAHQLIPIPDGVSFAQAASLPVAYGTAHRMMFENGNVKPGEKMLVLGASGGVGTCCVLLGKKMGMEVIACAGSQDKLDRLTALGSDHVLNYNEVDFRKQVIEMYGKPHRRAYEGGVDVVVNFTGGDTWVNSFKCMKRGGRLLTCGATAGFDPKTDIRFIWTFELKICGSNSWTKQDLVDLMSYIQDGSMLPVIDTVLPLEDGADGIRMIEDREVFGKIIIEP